ncbi:MAG: AraC family transcriptional regulator, partial [Bacteroidales bacterium]|nr:AraC family transcriptional regulator [Bacteroidales bacterium]
RDRQWGFYVNTVGHEVLSPHVQYPHPGHPEGFTFDTSRGRVISGCMLNYIVAGQGTLRCTSVPETRLRAGDMLLMLPNEWHTYWPEPDTGWESYWIGFGGELMDRWISEGFFTRENPIVHVGYNDRIISLFQRALDVAFGEKRGHQQLLSCLTGTICSAFLYDLSPDTLRFPGQQTDEDIVNRGRTIIRQTLSQDISIQEVARQLNVSYSYFRKHFKAYTGYSPAYYQQFLRLQMAKEMLQNTSATVAEVAYHFQFSSPDYFSFRFKEVLGESPSSFKRR